MAEADVSGVPSGLMSPKPQPGVETPGYSRLSLRDRAFVPNPLPPSHLDAEIHELIENAEAVARMAARKSQRDFVLQPKVARNELPWVNRPTNPQPQRGCANRLVWD